MQIFAITQNSNIAKLHKMKNVYLKALLYSIIPTMLLYIGKNDELFTWLISKKIIFDEKSNVSPVKWASFLMGIVWTGLVVPIQFEKEKKKNEKIKEEFSKLLGLVKDSQIQQIKSKLKIGNIKLNTRVFIKKTNFKYWWIKFIYDETYFQMVHIDGISDKFNSDKLKFRVHPNPEGLIGQVFTNSKSLMDLNVSVDKYPLNSYQQSKTADVKFCCAAPIFDEKSNIIAMISLDSKSPIVMKKEDISKWNDLMNEYVITLDKFINN